MEDGKSDNVKEVFEDIIDVKQRYFLMYITEINFKVNTIHGHICWRNREVYGPLFLSTRPVNTYLIILVLMMTVRHEWSYYD